MGVIQAIEIALCAITVLVVLVQMARNVPASNIVDALMGLTELAVVAQMVAGLVAVFGAPASVSRPTYVGYLVGALLILPAAWIWSQAERSRSSLGVLVVGLLVVPFLVLRLHQVWPGHG
ncbi:MAG: hypothetical protein ACTHNS_13675 [Marmoricola sp.]